MELEKISQILDGQKKVIFGPMASTKQEPGSYAGLPYLTVNVNEKTITFTSDTPDYLMTKRLEEAMEKLFSRFGIVNYKVKVHIHKGNWHDKDITLELQDIEGVQNSEEMPEIVKFIQDTFYKVEEWDFVAD